MVKLILSIILSIILFCNNVNLINGQGGGENFKMITLLSSNFDDLGFNNMLNRARVEVSKFYNIEDSRVIVIDGNATYDVVSKIIKTEQINLVLCTSQFHVDSCKRMANESLGATPQLITRFVIRGSQNVTKNTQQFTYNYASINYLSGVFAGLYTKTNKIGFLSPGASGGSNDSFVYAFWLGAKQINPDIKFIYYNIGAWLDEDVTVAATNRLIDEGCDVIGDTLDDFSSGEVSISRGLRAIGTNGFPQRDVYGENVVYSYAYNWTKIFQPIVKSAILNTNLINGYGDFNNDFYTLSYGYSVNDTIKEIMANKSAYLKNISRAYHPTNCNEYIYNYGLEHKFTFTNNTPPAHINKTQCIAGSNFFYINDPLPGMDYRGYYSIEKTEYKFSPSIQIGISTASGVLIALMLASIVAVYMFRDTSSIRSASPIFLIFILFGAIIVYVGIIVWVGDLNTAVCNARFWLVTLGFSTVIGSLVVKNFRIWLIFDNPHLKTVKITNYQLYPWVAVCLVINIILMSILTSVGDMQEVDAEGIDSLGKYEYMKVCKMNHAGASTLYTILAYFAALLLVGVFVSWKIRIVDIQEFNESKAIAHTLYAISFCLFVIVPLMISPQDKQSETIILCVAAFFIITSAILIIFIPKFWRVYEFGAESTGNEMFKSKKASTIAAARDSNKHSGGTHRTNRRGNIVSGDFSDSESSISEPHGNSNSNVAVGNSVNLASSPNSNNIVVGSVNNQAVDQVDVTSGAVFADFTEESHSEFDENENAERESEIEQIQQQE